MTKLQPATPPADRPQTKKLVVIRGRGTANEQRIETNVTLYWCNSLGGYVTVPEKGQ